MAKSIKQLDFSSVGKVVYVRLPVDYIKSITMDEICYVNLNFKGRNGNG